MERVTKKSKMDIYNVLRGLLKSCFKNLIYVLVPFEIWRDIISEGDPLSIARIAKTSRGFNEVVKNLRNLLFECALKHRRENRISEAKRYLLRCADIGDSKAMFYIGDAHKNFGWGLEPNVDKSLEWFKNSAQCGNIVGVMFYAFAKQEGTFVVGKTNLLCSSDYLFATGFYYFYICNDQDEAFSYFKLSAKQGNEFGQLHLGICYVLAQNYEKAFYWLLKSAEQGLALAQWKISYMLSHGTGCEKNDSLSDMWWWKSENQRID